VTFLRTMSTPRLIGVAAAMIAVGAGSVAVAEANLSGNPLPPPKPLAAALHDALSAPPVSGITARVAFTNAVIPAGALAASTPLLSGASGRVWVNQTGARIELQNAGGGGDTQISIAAGRILVYDAARATAYELALSTPAVAAGRDAHTTGGLGQQAISAFLARLVHYADIAGPVRRNLAGQPAYQIRVSPRHDGGLLGAVELAFDARHGVPLRIALYAAGNSTPVLALEVTDITYAPVSASGVAVTPPAGTKRVVIGQPAAAGASGATIRPVQGLAGVTARVGFAPRAPQSLVGLPRVTTTTIGGDTHPAALIVYGRGLGAIVIVERRADASATRSATLPAGLPAVQIDGATGSELATALGTVLQVRAGGIEYVIAGSVPPIAAEAAARKLLS
jgi:hypothetical protein